MKQNTVEIPQALKNHARERGIVVMAGAGVSAGVPSALPGWTELNRLIVNALCERIDSYLDKPEYTREIREAIETRRSANLFPPDYQAQILEESCGDHYFKALQALDVKQTNAGHEGIAWLAKHGLVKAVVTTNFDRLLEHALAAQGVKYNVAYDPKTYASCLKKLKEKVPKKPLPVLKVHGCARDHRSLIDTLKQRLLGRNRQLERCLDHLLQGYYWLFSGFSAADLETDDSYLRLLPAAAKAPGFTYVQWPGAKGLSSGAQLLVDAYMGKADVVSAELDIFVKTLCRSLDLQEPVQGKRAQGSQTAEQVQGALTDWAQGLHPAAAINCLAAIAEANGETDAAFQLLHRFWKDVMPADRKGADFELYRLYHGRIGMGGGILSYVDDMNTNAGMESLQNLLRRGGKGDARALAYSGLAFLWGGQIESAFSQLVRAREVLEKRNLPLEQRVDLWLASAEFLYVLYEPEDFFDTWGRANYEASKAGDLPRQARLAAMAALFFAEWLEEEYQEFMEKHAQAILDRAWRLNDPGIIGFTYLARGRYLTKQRDGTGALEALIQANRYLAAAGRPPWQILTGIEHAKALLDQKKAQEAAEVLNTVSEYVDRYQVWLPWLEEAKGQWYMCKNRTGEARQAFEQAVKFAQKMKLKRRTQILQGYFG